MSKIANMLNMLQILKDEKVHSIQELAEKLEIYIVTNSPTKVVKDKLCKIKAQNYIKNTFSAEEAGL